jgi:hypothetical protein
MRFCFRTVAGLMAIACVLPVVVGQPPGAGGPLQPTPAVATKPQPAKPQLKLKVFKLERGDPQAVIHSLNALLEESDVEVTPPMPPGGPPRVGAPAGPGGPPMGGMGVPQPGGLQGGGAGVPAPIGGMLGFGGLPPGGFGAAPQFGGIGCFLGSGGNVTPVWRATAQARTRAVIVRGSDRHLNVAADLVALLDRPASAPLPKLQVVQAFALKHATAEEVAEVINALSFDDVKLATPDERLLALIAPDDVVKSVAELVKELDVPDNGAPNPEPEPKSDGKASPARAADAQVMGMVTLDGKPIAEGKVTFHLANDQFVGSKIKDGRYLIERVPVGARKVTIEGKGIPAKYGSEETSSLTAEVKKGAEINFDLR